MPNIILHIGASKCGSSTIQDFFAQNEQPCQERIRYISPKQETIDEWGKTGRLTTKLDALLGNSRYDTLLVSHERFYHQPIALRLIGEALKDVHQSEKYIIGYSRKQGDYLVSAYGQWSFRGPFFPKKMKETAHELSLTASYFSGIEKYMMGYIVDDVRAKKRPIYAEINWKERYREIGDSLKGHGYQLKVGLLPNAKFSFNLVEDFCKKANLHLLPDSLAKTEVIRNRSFDKDLIEGLNNALNLGYQMPSPTEGNERIIALSQLLKKKETASPFLDALKAYIDTYFWEDNQVFCEQHGLDSNYFKPNRFWTRAEILELIQEEQEKRHSQPEEIIEEYRRIVAKLADLNWRLSKNLNHADEKKPALLERLKAKLLN